MGRFRPSGLRARPEARELLGPRITTCFRCGREFPERELRTVPPNAPPGVARILVCVDCSGEEEEPEDE